VFAVAALALLADGFAAQRIASTGSPYALYGWEQRKVARDSEGALSVVYTGTESTHDESSVCFVRSIDSGRVMWTGADTLARGYSPAIAIGRDDCLHVTYRANHSIAYLRRTPGGVWTEPLWLAGSGVPSIDVDSSGRAHVVWVEDGVVRYCRVDADSVSAVMTILSKRGASYVESATIAGDLGYRSDRMYVAYDYHCADGPVFLGTAIGMLRSSSGGEQWCTVVGDDDTLPHCPAHFERVDGSRPVLAIAYTENDYDEAAVMLYESESYLRCLLAYWRMGTEAEFDTFTLGPVQEGEYGIDNPTLPLGLGFSYVANRGDAIVHGYTTWHPANSFGGPYVGTSINNVVHNHRAPFLPSITYKQYKYDSVDVIWMEREIESADTTYEIMYERMPKGLMTGVAQPVRPTGARARPALTPSTMFDLTGGGSGGRARASR